MDEAVGLLSTIFYGRNDTGKSVQKVAKDASTNRIIFIIYFIGAFPIKKRYFIVIVASS